MCNFAVWNKCVLHWLGQGCETASIKSAAANKNFLIPDLLHVPPQHDAWHLLLPKTI